MKRKPLPSEDTNSRFFYQDSYKQLRRERVTTFEIDGNKITTGKIAASTITVCGDSRVGQS